MIVTVSSKVSWSTRWYRSFDAQIGTVRPARAIDPGLVVDARRFHDERVVVLPIANRIAEPLLGAASLVELSPIGPDGSLYPAKLVQDVNIRGVFGGI